MASDIFEKKLASSGLTLEDASLVGYRYLSPEETKALHPSLSSKEAMYFPYYHPITKKQYVVHEGTEAEYPYYRIRYLDDMYERTGFNRLIKKKNQYRQLPNSPNIAYYPMNVLTSWEEIINDRSQPVIITEGELKAAKSCQMGFPTIAIGGAHSWQQKSKGVNLLESLTMLGLNLRTIYICFDSDYRNNQMVLAGLRQLGDILAHHGADVYCISLPDLIEGAKTGMDDFFILSGETSKFVFTDLIKKAIPWGCTGALRNFNERYCLSLKPIAIIDKRLSVFYNKNDFSLVTNNQYSIQQILDKKGEIFYDNVRTNKIWLEWGQRDTVDTVCYEPGKEQLTAVESDGKSLTAFNTWGGWGVSPKKGDVTLFLRLIDFLFSTTPNKEIAMKWFLQWLAYPFQHPGTKLKAAVLLHGATEGSGKTTIGNILKRLYGNNYSAIGNKELAAMNQFNGWSANKCFIVANEVVDARDKATVENLKILITEPTIIVNKKFIDPYEIKNCINFLFTSNRPDALSISLTERRYFIIEAPTERPSIEYFNEIYNFIDSEDGPAFVMDYLLNYDLTGFNPHAPAMMTNAKQIMLGLSLSDIGRFLLDILDFPDLYADKFPSELVTAGDVLAVYKKEITTTDMSKSRLSVQGVSKEMNTMGFHRVHNYEQIRLKNKTVVRLYAIRNKERWKEATLNDIQEYLGEKYVAQKEDDYEFTGKF